MKVEDAVKGAALRARPSEGLREEVEGGRSNECDLLDSKDDTKLGRLLEGTEGGESGRGGQRRGGLKGWEFQFQGAVRQELACTPAPRGVLTRTGTAPGQPGHLIRRGGGRGLC